MADETNDKDQNFARLREKNEKLESEVKKLRKLAVDGLVHQAGFDPKDPIASLVREKWESDIEDFDEATPDAFTEFASKFNLTPTGGQVADDDGDDDDDLAAQIETAQRQRDAARGQEPQSKGPQDDIVDAENKGDFNASFMAKLSQLPTAQV